MHAIHDLTSSRRRERGFALLIGLVLLMGMTLLALSLFSNGLFETRSAYQVQQRSANFQANDGLIDQLLLDLLPDSAGEASALMAQLLELDEGGSVGRPVCASGAGDCTGNGSIKLIRMDKPCVDETLIRALSSSDGQALCRYYEAEFERQQRRDILRADSRLHQGLFDITYGATQRNGLAIEGGQ